MKLNDEFFKIYILCKCLVCVKGKCKDLNICIGFFLWDKFNFREIIKCYKKYRNYL